MTEKIITLSLLLGSTVYLYFANQLTFGTLKLPNFPTKQGRLDKIYFSYYWSTFLHYAF